MKHKEKLAVSLVFSGYVIFSIIAHAETIVLKSGKTIEGKIVARTQDDITVEAYGQQIKYYFHEIESRSIKDSTLPSPLELALSEA